MIGSLRGTLLERSPDGEVLVEVGGVGYRVTVTPAHARPLGEPGAEVVPLRSTTTSARTPRRSTASPPATSGPASRPCSAPTASARRWPWPSSSVHTPERCGGRWPTTTSTRSASCPVSGKKTAARLLVELKARLDLPERRPHGGRPPATGANGDGRGPRRPTCARPSPASATAPTRSATVLPRPARPTATPADLLREALAHAGGAAAMREELLEPAARPTASRPRKPACGPGASTSSSARPS